MQNKILLLALIFSLFSCNKPAPSLTKQAGQIEHETSFKFEKGEVESLKSIVSEIVKRFPHDQYLYVGVGRSPTPVIVLLEKMYKNSTLHFPASKLKWVRPDFTDAEDNKIYKEHFDKFFNNKQLVKNNKKILLIDLIQSGMGLVHAKKFFEKYAKKDSKILAIGLVCDTSVSSKGSDSMGCQPHPRLKSGA